ncbi:neuropathy target esterase sws isoform X2 [Nasonia vitripennis]|uniref:Neuropathy target esterase sws n=1 Tax=Nasonia vitripennis TaxID=7425 RepID=A0A7M7HC64_NASVI|nr:neuropathy target esterase sws isoform X2 [Nasonia vitripennis]
MSMMEVVELINRFNDSLGSYAFSRWIEHLIIEYQTSKTLLAVSIGILLSILAISIYVLRKWKTKELLPQVREFVGVGTGRPRFRKRDKVLFYGRKMLRKVKSIGGQVPGTGQGKKRRAVMRFARRLLQLKKDNAPQQLKVLEPPAEYLEEDVGPGDRVPPDALYILQSIRVFGHFEKPVFLKLCKHTEIMNLPAGTPLFRIGDPDENVFIVQQGLVNVYITGSDGSQISLKLVKTGESVTSLLSFTDVLTGHTSTYKTVAARAVEDSVVVKLPMSAFQEVFQDHPDAFVRVIQVIMVRLQRVTFTALHQYLGLSAELVNQGSHKKKHSSVSQMGSPVRSRTRENFNLPVSENATSYPGASDLQQLDISVREFNSASQPVPIMSSRRSKTNLEWKTPNSGSQLSQHTSDIVPDCDSPWPNSATSNQHSSHPGESSDGGVGVGSTGLHSGSASRKQSRIEGFQQPPLDEAQVVQIATEAFVKELGLEDDTLLKEGKVQIREVPAGTYLMKEESHKDVALVFVVSGSLIISQRASEGREAGEDVHMFSAHQGEIVGGLAVLTGEPSFYTIRAKHSSRIALLSKSTFFSIMREKPTVVLHVAKTVVKRLSPFVRQVDFALDWLFLESGRAVYRQGDESDSTFIVLSGRLRSVITYENGKKELVAEYGKGDLVGIVEMVTQTPRSTTVMAVRDSELAKLPEGLFNVIKLRYPIVVTRLINLLGHRLLGTWKQAGPKNGSRDARRAVDARPSQVNFSTVAIVPITDDVPLTAFTYELYHSLCAIGPCLRLTSDVIRKTLGSSIMESMNEYRLTSWLAQQEDQHRISLYQCDSNYTPWTQRCVRQADCILIVGLGDRPPTLGRTEREVERLAMRTQKELVLLHKEQNGQRPANTVQWLNMRSWVSSHHHIQCPKRMFTRKSQYRINELYSKVLMSEPNVHSDFSRLARWLTGTSVGLVLGGGGARGASHVGMLKAIMEAGIPIDMVGGVSIGAFMGALWCMEKNITTTTQKAREWSKKMTQWWRQILDLTYPMTSMFSGKDFNKTIHGTFGDVYIEDLWLPYFTITTDITASCMRTHTHGSLWRYIRASMSLSGYMPPMCDPTDGHLLLDGGYVNNLPGLLWKYIRASMTIAGVFPPICDPIDGHLLVDGCYVNNVPADEMLRQGAHHILAIDVGSQDDTDLTNYGDSLSGWWLLWKRWNPFATPVKVPNLPDIQSRLAYVSCVRQLEEVKNSDYCEYIRPPIDKYKTLQFANFDEIKDVGYNHGKTYFEGQSKAGILPRFNADRENAKALRAKHQQAASQQAPSSYTFTDLAQMVCKVSRGNRYTDIDSDSDGMEEYEADLEEDAQEVGYASEPTAGILDQSPEDARLRRRAGVSLSLSDTEADADLEYRMSGRNTPHQKFFKYGSSNLEM